MALGDVVEQGAECRRFRWQGRLQSTHLFIEKTTGQQTDRGRFHIAFAAGDLTGEADMVAALEPQSFVEQLWRIQIGVAVQAAETGKFSILQAGNAAENLNLGAIFELRLKTHHVVERAEGVVLTQLDHGIGLFVRLMGIGQPHRLHRAVTQGFASALRHHLDW